MKSKNKYRSPLLLFACLWTLGMSCHTKMGPDKANSKNPYYSTRDTEHLNVSDAEWKTILPDTLFRVARLKETEAAFSGTYWNFEGLGSYSCAVCGNLLFRSDAKFASECGWPSFFEVERPNSVVYKPDSSYGMDRTEVLCGRCDSHLGHIFDDGPPPTNKRYCMNSISLSFTPDDTLKLMN